MHLHTIHQPGASMESHIYNAYTMGMKYIRFTDHDTRTGESKKTVNSFDLTRGVLEYKTDAEVTCGLELIGEFTPEFVNNTLHISGGKRNGVTLCASGKKQSRALVSDVTLTLGMAHRLTKGGRIIIDILLSQRPPDHKEAHLLYVIGEPYSGELKPHYVTTPLAPREDGIYSLHISEDVERFPEIGGCDNVFGTVSIIIEGEGEIELSRLEISSVYNYDEVIRRQRESAQNTASSPLSPPRSAERDSIRIASPPVFPCSITDTAR